MKKYWFCLIFLLVFISVHASANYQNEYELLLKKEIIKMIDQQSPLIIQLSDKIWEYAEIALLEYDSSKLLEDILENAGFIVERDVAGMPTAFVATYGSGIPIIGILAEYDALPGLSQDSVPTKKVLNKGGAGHGCGHNLFGAGSVGAALSLREVMTKHNLKGTIRLYGCPAEEDVGGKVYMAREGLFDDLDACVAWHPYFETSVDVSGSQAIDDLEFEFFGKTAHAAADPWMGNSALDAVEMMNFGINLLREHVKPTVRIHYVIRDGGDVPNVVPEYARLWLWVRDSKRVGVKMVVDKVKKIAEGSAMATGTTTKISLLGSYHEMLVNLRGSQIMQKNLEMIGPIQYSDEEIEYAKLIQKEAGVSETGMDSQIPALREPAKDPEGGSTDVAEVSWITPTVHMYVTCTPHGIPWHSWAVVTSCKHPIGHKGMILAAKVLATTCFDFLRDPGALEEMQKEHKEKLGGYRYQSGIPPDQKPPIRIKDSDL